MKDIFKFFRGSSKKRDLSHTLKAQEDPKKMRYAKCASFVTETDDFNKGIDSSGCRVILFNCLKNIEAKVWNYMNKETKTKICILKAKSKAEPVKFMKSKIDELDKDRKEKKKIINNLKGDVSYH